MGLRAAHLVYGRASYSAFLKWLGSSANDDVGWVILSLRGKSSVSILCRGGGMAS